MFSGKGLANRGKTSAADPASPAITTLLYLCHRKFLVEDAMQIKVAEK
jgi:hypothetical protein